MPSQRWALIAVVALGWAGESTAQSVQPLSVGNASSVLTGVNPSSVIPPAGNLAGASSGANVVGSSQSQFSLSSFFRRFSIFSSPNLGQSSVPTPGFANPVMPLMPINSTAGTGGVLIPQIYTPVVPALPINP